VTAPADTDAPGLEAEPARQCSAHCRTHCPSTTEATPRSVLRLQLRTAHGQTTRHAVPILVRAFTATPLARWLYPTPSERGNHLHEVFARLIYDAADNGSLVLAYRGNTTVGAALWSTCPARDDTDPAATAITPHDPTNERLTVLAHRLGHGHPPEPHEHLHALAVLPRHQGQGIAGALLASATTRPATSRYLLTPGPLRDLLHRLGYQPYGNAIALPGDGPPLQPFWCPAPRPQPSDHSGHQIEKAHDQRQPAPADPFRQPRGDTTSSRQTLTVREETKR
jgi:GNAT superfamily N-acetyltransferase